MCYKNLLYVILSKALKTSYENSTTGKYIYYYVLESTCLNHLKNDHG